MGQVAPPVPSPVPSPASESGVPVVEPGSLSPVVPSGTETPVVPTAPPAPESVRGASPLPRFELPDDEDEEQFARNLSQAQPLVGLMPSEEVRIRRFGMMHAGAAMAEAADSGKGFAAAVTQGLLAGAMASEQARSSYAQQRLQELEEGRKRRELEELPRPYEPKIESLDQEVLDREYANALEAGDKDMASEIRLIRDDLARAGEGAGALEYFPQEDGSLQGFIRFGTKMVPVEGAIKMRDPNNDKVDIYNDGFGNRIRETIDGVELSRSKVKADGSVDQRSIAELLTDDPGIAFADIVQSDNEYTTALDDLRNFRAGLGDLSIGNILDETADPLAAHAQLFAYINGLDDTAVREGEVAMLERLGILYDLPKNWWERKVGGLVTPEKVRRAIATYTRLKGGASLDIAGGRLEYYKKTGRKYGMSDGDMDEAVGGGLMQMYSAAQRFDTHTVGTMTDNERKVLKDLYKSSGIKGYGQMDWGNLLDEPIEGEPNEPTEEELFGSGWN